MRHKDREINPALLSFMHRKFLSCLLLQIRPTASRPPACSLPAGLPLQTLTTVTSRHATTPLPQHAIRYNTHFSHSPDHPARRPWTAFHGRLKPCSAVQRRAGGQNTAARPCLDDLFENRLLVLSDCPSLPLPPGWRWSPLAAASRVMVDDGLERELDMKPPSSGG